MARRSDAEAAEPDDVVIYTDGACIGNPGPGGYGVVLVYERQRKELAKGFRRTTNNRMELLAAIAGLESLKQASRVRLFSDSEYLVRAMSEGWARRWRENGWRRSRKERAVNPDLWGRLLDLCDQHAVQFQWVRGHSGNVENERCDRLAVAAAMGRDLAVDEGYEGTGRRRESLEAGPSGGSEG
ncbi:MAG: ribonuclease HI [Chloroflexi bacterium]|nr:ribonuclease HI [Chloroflexota bacterium]